MQTVLMQLMMMLIASSLTGCASSDVGHRHAQFDHVPRELRKVAQPNYVIEPPDILLIETVNHLRRADSRMRAGDTLIVQVSRTVPIDPLEDEIGRQFKQISGPYIVDTLGRIDFGPEYGSCSVSGMSFEETKRAIASQLRRTLANPQIHVMMPEPFGKQQISGEHLVRPDGTVSLGIYGSVYVTGMELTQAKSSIERHLADHLHSPEVNVDVLAYNSKVYYIVTDGGGAGEQVYRLPCTGSETVLDAIAQVQGLPAVASKSDIWVARPAPPELGKNQIMQVDWNGIVQGAETESNYQVMPGDRIYVKADKLIAMDTVVAKLTAPFERLLGFVLLGNGTVRALQSSNATGIGGGF